MGPLIVFVFLAAALHIFIYSILGNVPPMTYFLLFSYISAIMFSGAISARLLQNIIGCSQEVHSVTLLGFVTSGTIVLSSPGSFEYLARAVELSYNAAPAQAIAYFISIIGAAIFSVFLTVMVTGAITLAAELPSRWLSARIVDLEEWLPWESLRVLLIPLIIALVFWLLVDLFASDFNPDLLFK